MSCQRKNIGKAPLDTFLIPNFSVLRFEMNESTKGSSNIHHFTFCPKESVSCLLALISSIDVNIRVKILIKKYFCNKPKVLSNCLCKGYNERQTSGPSSDSTGVELRGTVLDRNQLFIEAASGETSNRIIRLANVCCHVKVSYHKLQWKKGRLKQLYGEKSS